MVLVEKLQDEGRDPVEYLRAAATIVGRAGRASEQIEKAMSLYGRLVDRGFTGAQALFWTRYTGVEAEFDGMRIEGGTLEAAPRGPFRVPRRGDG